MIKFILALLIVCAVGNAMAYVFHGTWLNLIATPCFMLLAAVWYIQVIGGGQ